MSTDISVLLIASVGLLATACLIALNNIRANAESKKNEPVVLDYIDYVKRKSEGDVIDQLIAEKLEIEKFVA